MLCEGMLFGFACGVPVLSKTYIDDHIADATTDWWRYLVSTGYSTFLAQFGTQWWVDRNWGSPTWLPEKAIDESLPFADKKVLVITTTANKKESPYMKGTAPFYLADLGATVCTAPTLPTDDAHSPSLKATHAPKRKRHVLPEPETPPELQAKPLTKHRAQPETPPRFVRNQRNILAQPSVVQYVNPNKPIPVFARHHLLGEWVVGVITYRQGQGVDIT